MFILYEDFISMLLKEYNIYKIGITVDAAITLLKEKNIEDEDKNLIYKTIIDKIIIQRKEVIEVVFK